MATEDTEGKKEYREMKVKEYGNQSRQISGEINHKENDFYNVHPEEKDLKPNS
jgi:hypothetical protein